MLYLLLGMLCSSSMGAWMRFTEKKMTDKMAAFLANYIVCFTLARIFMGNAPLFPENDALPLTLMLGAISGVFYLASLAVNQWNLSINGMILSSTFSRLGVIVPTLTAIIFFGEKPKAIQIAGLVLAAFAIVLINSDREGAGLEEKKGELSQKTLKAALMINLIMGGSGEVVMTIFENTGHPELKDHYLFFNFVFAAVSTIVMMLIRRKRFSFKDILIGIVIGVPNYMSSRFMLLSLQSIPATVAFPVSCVGIIVMNTLIGTFFFKEKLSRAKALAIGVIMVSLVLLNI